VAPRRTRGTRGIERLFSDFLSELPSSTSMLWPTGGLGSWELGSGGGRMLMDIAEVGENYEMRCDLPGIPKENINIKLDENLLTIEGTRRNEWEENREGVIFQEREFGKVSRSIRLPLDADPERVSAKFEHGTLMLTVAKTEHPKAKSISID